MRILIADDESIIRMGLKSILKEMGHTVFDARDGREALQMARKHQIDFAIFDIKMPYTDGIQAAKTLYRTNPIPIVLLTAFADSDLIERASDLPIHGYLIKPVDPKALEATMAVAAKRFENARELENEKAKLELTLETRKLVDRAKGKLMVEKGLNEEDAYRLLQLTARNANRPMREVASAILKSGAAG